MTSVRSFFTCAPRLVKRSVAFVFLFLSAHSAFAGEIVSPKEIATKFLDSLERKDFKTASTNFDAVMTEGLPPAKLAAVWASIQEQFGSVKSRDMATVIQKGEMQIVTVPIQCERGALVVSITINKERKIAGFFVQPQTKPSAGMPATSKHEEHEITVGTLERGLPGTLTMPASHGGTLVPAVILVHGSGPTDRNETIGPNRPFFDLAQGLADHGIAVIRYDKRTWARPQDFANDNYSIDDETTNDAVYALEMARTIKGIDPRRTFVLGHSQGGMLAPRIAHKSSDVAGVILFAAPARPLSTLVVEQNRLVASLDGTITADEQEALNSLEKQFANLRRGTPSIKSTDSPLGLPAKYWRDLDKIDPLADAKSLNKPLLLLQGGRDIQVTQADWALWQESLGGSPLSTLKFYPDLNHLGITGVEPPSFDDSKTPGQVDLSLIADISKWILEINKLQIVTR